MSSTPMTRRPLVRLSCAVLVTAALALTGCSGGSEAPPSPSAPMSESASAAPSSAPAGECLVGAYRLVGFSASGTDTPFGDGSGGDVTFTFTDGAFVIASPGNTPVDITVGNAKAALVFKGDVKGTYAGPVDGLTFKVTSTSGKAMLYYKGLEREISADQVANVIAPGGKAKATCSGDKLAIEYPAVTLALQRA